MGLSPENPNRRTDMKQVAVVSFFSTLLLVTAGCSRPPEYKYQKVGESAKTQEAEAKKEGTTPSTNVAATEATVSAEPGMPEVSVAEILRGSLSYDNRRVRVSGRIGRLLPHYSMGFIIGASDKSHIEFSYGRTSDSDKDTLERLNPLREVAVTGVWDASRKLLIGEEVNVE
jgi:hypothetical protein